MQFTIRMKTHFAKNTYQTNFHKETLEISKEKIMENFLEILPGKGGESHGQAQEPNLSQLDISKFLSQNFSRKIQSKTDFNCEKELSKCVKSYDQRKVD